MAKRPFEIDNFERSITSSHNNCPDNNSKSDSLAAEIECHFTPCNLIPLIFSDYQSYEAHYMNRHHYYCEVCSKEFPDNRILDLHFEENHDPFFGMKKERQEAIYRCFEVFSNAKCEEKFHTHDERNVHMMRYHGYPKDFDFDIVNSGWKS